MSSTPTISQPPQAGGPSDPSGGPPGKLGQPASWNKRAIAYLWDILYILPATVAAVCGLAMMVWGSTIPAERNNTDPTRIGLIILLSSSAWAVVRLARNRFLDQGQTGWTYGKRKVGIRALNAETDQPIGVGSAFARDLINGVLNIVVFMSYLWPLGDSHKQTFGDKLLNVSVTVEPDPEGAHSYIPEEDSTGGDLVAGAVFFFLGIGFSYGAAGYDLRSFSNPGPGLFPVLIGLIIAGLGVTIFIRALLGKGEVTPGLAQFPWRAASLLSASMVFFTYAIEDLGLVFTAAGTSLLASAASPDMTVLKAVGTSIGLGLMSYVLFGVLLNMSIPSFPWEA